MKTLPLILSLAVVGVGGATANAQQFVPASVSHGAVLGAVAGALIGGHNHDRWGEGALIGAAAGALLGAAVAPAREAVYERPATVRVIERAPVVCDAPTVTYVPATAPTVVTYVEREPARVVYVERPAPVRVVYVTPGYGYGYAHEREHGRGCREREVVYYAPRGRGW